jgi:membrane protein
LTYYTILATVPILTLFVLISNWFGLRYSLYDRLLPSLAESREIVLEFFTFANALIVHAKGGVIAALGSAILFLSVTQLVRNLESSMNRIWKVEIPRSWLRVFADSFILVLVILGFYLISTFLASIASGLISNLITCSLAWVLFTFIYLFMPHRKIPISSAILGGVVGGTIYLLFQWTYVYFQFVFLRLGAVYGSFTAVPLFLLWVQASWCILLYGAEVSAYAKKTD